MSDHKLFQDTKTGKLVEFITSHDKEFAMVKDAAGGVTFMMLDQLVPYDPQKGRMAKIAPVEQEVPEEPIPQTVVPIEDTRLNLNAAPAEQIAKTSAWCGFCNCKKRSLNCVCR